MKKAYTVKYRRRREARTDYRSRRDLLASGKSRAVIRKSLNGYSIQLIQFDTKGDKTQVSTNSSDLRKLGWKAHTGSIPAAYLTGYIFGLKAIKKNQEEGIVDIGLARSIKGSGYYAVIKGMIDAGFKINCSKEMFPSEQAITGKIIENYAKELLKDKDKYTKQFSLYIKAGLKPEELNKHFEEIKKKAK